MIPTERKRHLQSIGLEPDREMIPRVRAFAVQSGLTYGELAELAGLNPNSLRVYLTGHYDKHEQADSNTLVVRAALKAAMDRHELQAAPPVQGAHHATAEYDAIRKSMWSALRKGTAFLVDGAPGTQKTYTFRRVAQEINRSGEGRAVYVYARVDHSPQSFLVEACAEAGVPNRGNIDQLIRKLRFFLGGSRTLLLVDEAQHLGFNGLEVLRQLLDQPPYFGVGLGGSHDLAVRIGNWRMEQWRSRLRRQHVLKGLSEAEAAAIVTAELGPLNRNQVAALIAKVTSKAERNGEKYSYISARNLFFAIQGAREVMNDSAEAEKVEAIA